MNNEKLQDCQELTKNTNILLLVGASGSGKTFIADMLMNTNNDRNIIIQNHLGDIITFHKPIQITTREPREDETLNSYIFFDKENFKKLKADEFLTCKTYFNNNNYGTIKNTIVKNNNVVNLIIANLIGKNDILNTFKDDEDANIKTAIVLSDFNEDIIKSHNNRNFDIASKELIELLQYEYDFYIPNYSNNRCNLARILEILNLNYINQF